MGTREDIEDWVRLKVEAWAYRVHTLDKISKQYPQLVYAGLGMLIHIEWQYLLRTVPGVGNRISTI